MARGREFYECCILMLNAFPVHFGFLDAWVSGDGFSGHVHDAKPNQTNTIFASENVFALDWVMGEKMNINPALNYVVQEAITAGAPSILRARATRRPGSPGRISARSWSWAWMRSRRPTG